MRLSPAQGKIAGEATTGFEPVMEVLQTSALPLGYFAEPDPYQEPAHRPHATSTGAALASANSVPRTKASVHASDGRFGMSSRWTDSRTGMDGDSRTAAA